MPRLWQRPVLLRLGLVFVTTAAATLLIFLWGPPLPFRVGEIYPNDLRVRVYFEVLNQPQTEWKREEAAGETGDPVAREEIRRAVLPVVERYPPGLPLVQRDHPITERQLALLEEEHRTYLGSLEAGDHWRRGVALFLVMSLLTAVVVLYVARFQHGLVQSFPKIGAVCALALITLVMVLLLSRPPWFAVIIPLTFTAMILTIVYNPQFALLMSFSLALATTVALNNGLNLLLILMGGLATSI
ncbi:MAG TPA: hypothetical protein VGY77_10450, partial [Gemmataceae bacterium]|nr:hypothetical protein [Gemmataceae bacterium]